MIARTLFIVLALLPTLAAGAELDLFVTDYMEKPSANQRPLVDRPLAYAAPREVTVTTADGKTLTYKTPSMVSIERKGEGDPRRATLFASPGEYEPFSLLLRPHTTLPTVFLKGSALKGPAGTIPASNVTIHSAEGILGKGRTLLLPLGRTWNMGARSTEHFWYTVRVPADAKPGLYKGEVAVTSKGQRVAAIAVELDVLPIQLEDPPYGLGFNYSNPKDPKLLALQLADMREHGMTCVAPLYEWHLPVHDTDTSELGALIEAYKRAGFTAPLFFASPMSLQLSALAGYGDERSKRWQQKFIEVMRLLHAETLKHDVPVLMSIGDELTNKGVEGVKIAGRLARFVWEELPEIATTSDMNGYREVMAMAPFLNVATFNNGWDGIDHHNGGRHLINRAFILELQRETGAIPWFVNAGSERLPFGFFFWKMAKLGVRGKVEWYYNLRNGNGSLVKLDGARITPTIEYERCREGVDDLKYVCKLESLIGAAKAAGKAQAERAKAEALLTTIEESIQDDWSAYSAGGARFPEDGFAVLDPQKAIGFGSFNAVRRAVADRIVALQAALD